MILVAEMRLGRQGGWEQFGPTSLECQGRGLICASELSGGAC